MNPSNQAQAPPKTKPTRKRASTPRSKTGCITCKIRRLKCGEEKPRCLRCVKSGWQCEGYEQRAEAASASSLAPMSGLAPLRPRSHSPQSPNASRQPSQSPSINHPLDEREQHYFQRFMEERSPNIDDIDAYFWKQVALQECQTNSCVRHACIAIGALVTSTYKSPSGCHLMDMNISQGLHREFALQQYQKAIRSLRESIADLSTPEGNRTTLMSCMVLAFFDNFVGNGSFAAQHIRYARNILLNSAPLQIAWGSEQIIFPNLSDRESTLAYLFLRMDMQDSYAMGIDPSRSFVVMGVTSQPIYVPERFYDIEEAKRYRHLLKCEGYHFLYRTAYCSLMPPEAVPPDYYESRNFMIDQIHRFHAALEPLLVESAPDSRIHPLLRTSSLKHSTVILLIRLVMSLNTSEMEADSLLPYFEYLFSISRDILEYEAEVDSTRDHEIYVFEIRTICPLSLLALKCRSSPLRHQAISLMLSSYRREWLYDSLIAGRVAEWITSLEEEGMDEIGYIAEENRAWGESIELDLQRKVANVKVKVGRKAGGHWIERRKEISW